MVDTFQLFTIVDCALTLKNKLCSHLTSRTAYSSSWQFLDSIFRAEGGFRCNYKWSIPWHVAFTSRCYYISVVMLRSSFFSKLICLFRYNGREHFHSTFSASYGSYYKLKQYYNDIYECMSSSIYIILYFSDVRNSINRNLSILRAISLHYFQQTILSISLKCNLYRRKRN